MTAVSTKFPHLVIRASAGTGKTFQLSNRFLALVAAGEPLDSILATTFTRKAAGEILDRVLTRLAEAALDPKKQAELAKHVDPSLDQARCQRLLRDMVRHLHRLRVGTLDSFFIQVARSFSLELGLPPAWQIIDEVDDRRMRAEAIRTVLREESTMDVVALMNLLTKGEATRSVSEQITLLVNDLYSVFVEAPAEAWQAVPRHKELAPEELQRAIATLAAVPVPKGNRLDKARELNLAAAQAGDWLEFLAKGLAAKILDGTEAFYNKPIPEDLVAAYRPLMAHAKAVLVGRIANQTDATRRLLEHFDEAYQRLKMAQRALRFEDVTRKLGGRWVAERLQEVVFRLDAHLSHLLLDEFQDTSPLQWRVLRPFARTVVDGAKRRSFFCVGDVKQAIYGWRGGVAEIFEAISDDLPRIEPGALNQSFRSCQVVIDTVNRVFQGLTKNEVLERYPEAAARWASRFEAHSTAKNLAGHCQLIVAPEAAEGEVQGPVTLRYAAQRVAQLHRDAPGRSIGVLVRRNVAVARLIYELRNLDIEASEEGGNPLTDSPAVQLVLSLLALADHPGDTVARYHVAHSPLGEAVGLRRFDDASAAWRLSQSLRERLMTDGYGATLYAWAKQLAEHCDRRDLNRLVQLVELAYGYQASATTRADDFINLVRQQKVEDPSSSLVRVMTVHQSKGLQFDMVVLPELDVRLVGQPPQIAVGRPRPTDDIECVCRYVARNLRPLLPARFSALFDAHERQVAEESLCVLYVALTRAVHALHLIVAPSRPTEKTIPATSAGLLRAALTDGHIARPGEVLFEHGQADWMLADAPPVKPEAAPVQAAQPPARAAVLRLAPVPKHVSRGLERQSPSQLEGGRRVNLADRMRLDSSRALDRGSLMHAWFEQIEWLDEHTPEREKLQELASAAMPAGLDLSSLIDEFEQALARPAIRALLTRATYEQPATVPAAGAVHYRPGLVRPRWSVWRERPFALREGDTIQSGKIDRLVVLYDGDRPLAADLVDFKTDRVSPDKPEAIDARVAHYRPQLEAYRRAVARLLRLDVAQVSARLAFVEAGVVRAV